MRSHAADHHHLYGHLMRGLADDWEAGGPTREIFQGWEAAPEGSVVQLRLLAGLFRIVLTGRAPELVPYYPCLGGIEPPAEAWPRVRDVLVRHTGELHDALDVAPQTNEVGRSTALLVGLFAAVRRTGLSRVRLLEPGASAGLNLLVDQFRFVNPDWEFGPIDSPLMLADGVQGDVSAMAFEVVARRGCDLQPVDATTDEGQLRLRSFVWPFQPQRHERLNAALVVAGRFPITVDRRGAGEWLEEQLSGPVDADVLTVVWQSITRLYWPAEEVKRVEAAVGRAASSAVIAHIAMEYPSEGPSVAAELTLAVSGATPEILATVGDHGTPVALLGA
ncbi:MAG: DUF2332 domain-containing protein [Nocardioidaceae bacterium]|nr:DUF2332 domain-containing protein [Nocardioidaceae bacterium]